MPAAAPECPECGRAMDFRLGAYECPGCGRLILVQPLDEPEPAVEPEPEAGLSVESPPPPPVKIDWAKGQVLGAAEFLAPPAPAGELPVNAGSPGTPFTPGHAPAPGLPLPIPADGNTSGMGAGYPLPLEARGWTNASMIPGGLFSFYTGSWLWGVLGAVGLVFGFAGIAYFIMVGLRGKEDAWRGRRFASVEEYVAVMAAWNRAGMVIVWVSLALLVVGGLILICVLQRVVTSLELN